MIFHFRLLKKWTFHSFVPVELFGSHCQVPWTEETYFKANIVFFFNLDYVLSYRNELYDS